MDAQIHGTIVWVSAFYNRTGLAVGARAWVKALYNAGINIRIISINDVQSGIDDCDIDFFKSLEQTPVTPPVTAIFFNNPAESWLNVQLPKPNVRIMYTGFVGDNVPPHLLYICNRMDQLCIMNEAENATWVISGINQELVRVVSGIHPWQFLPIVPVGKGVCYSSDQIFRFLSMGTFFPNCR